jgi:hypothetical protein
MSTLYIVPQVVNSAGGVLNATAEFYESGTSTALEVYSDAGLTSSLGSTINADSTGYFGGVYLKSQIYRVVRKIDGVILDTEDDINDNSSAVSLFTKQQSTTITLSPTNTLTDALATLETYKLATGDSVGYDGDGPRVSVSFPSGKTETNYFPFSYPYGTAVLFEGQTPTPDRTCTIVGAPVRQETTHSGVTTETSFTLDVSFWTPARAHDLYVYDDDILKEPEKDTDGDYTLSADSTTIIATSNWTPGGTVRVMHGYALTFTTTDTYAVGDIASIESVIATGPHADSIACRHRVIAVSGSNVTVRVLWTLDAALDLGTVTSMQVRKMASWLDVDVPDPDLNDDTANAFGITSLTGLNFDRVGLTNRGTYHDTTLIGVAQGAFMTFYNAFTIDSPKHGVWTREGANFVGNNTQFIGARENGIYIAQGGSAQLVSAEAYGSGVALRLSNGVVEGSSFKCRNNLRGISMELGSSVSGGSIDSQHNVYYDLLLEEGGQAFMPTATLGEAGKTTLSVDIRAGSLLHCENATINGIIRLEPGAVLIAPGLSGTYTIEHDFGDGYENTAVNHADALGGGVFTDLTAVPTNILYKHASATPAIQDMAGDLPKLDFVGTSGTLAYFYYAAGKFITRVGSKNVTEHTSTSFRPGEASIDNGTSSDPWGQIHTNEGFYYGGNQVVGAQQSAIADVGAAPTQSDHNAVLAVLRAHGLIDT